MNKIILSYYFNFYKGYTENTKSKFEFNFYSIASTFVLAFTLFCAFISISLIMNYFLKTNIPIHKNIMYVYLTIFVFLAYYYIFILNNISKTECVPDKYSVNVTKFSKFISYSFLILNFAITIILAATCKL